MKKFSQIIWNQYKNSEDGQKTISLFRDVYSSAFEAKKVYDIAREYDERLFMNASDDERTYDIHYIGELYTYLKDGDDEESIQAIASSKEQKRAFFSWLLQDDIQIDGEFEDVPQRYFKGELSRSILDTWVLYAIMPQAFIPNLFALQFHYLARFAREYDIEQPKVPSRSAYKDRCMYYVELNQVLLDYAHHNGITIPEEVCAFWFGLVLPLMKEEIETDRTSLPETPEQAWLLVGQYGDEERNMESGFWQANPMTKRGDIMVFYEKSPVKAVNAVWIALDDGVADPFFPFIGYSWIGHKIEIPADKALTYQDFKNNDYFKNREKKGNFVSKNFQDCSGWAVTYDDYAEIKRMLQEKGFDISVLPSLYEPEGVSAKEIHHENDVYKKLVTPMLEQMGWKEGEDFLREVEFAAGHSTTGHAMNKRPDYCLHLSYVGKKVYAKVIIEAKYSIRNVEELSATFDQCLSYASWGQAKVMVLCDKDSIYVYEQNKKGQFELEGHVARYRWEQLSNPEIFKELKRKLE